MAQFFARKEPWQLRASADNFYTGMDLGVFDEIFDAAELLDDEDDDGLPYDSLIELWTRREIVKALSEHRADRHCDEARKIIVALMTGDGAFSTTSRCRNFLTRPPRGTPARACACPGCKKDTTHRCSVCRVVRYCSAACQLKHWDHHHLVCQALRQANFVIAYFGCVSHKGTTWDDMVYSDIYKICGGRVESEGDSE